MLTPRKKAAYLALITVLALTFMTLLHHQLGPPFLHSLLPGRRGSNLTHPRFVPPLPLQDYYPAFTDQATDTPFISWRSSSPVTRLSGAGPRRQKLVYVCSGGCGGWADRQKGIVSTYVLAAILERDFGVHVTFPCDLQQLLDVGRVDWRVSAQDLTGPGYQQVTQLDHGAVEFTNRILRSPNLAAHFPRAVTGLTWNMEVVQFLQRHPSAARVGWLAGRPPSEVYRRALRDLFVLKPDLQRQLDQLQKGRPPGTRLVCAQVRLGKHEGFPDVESLHSVGDFPFLVKFLAQYNDTRRFRLFFASDSVEILRQAKAKFPETFLQIPGPITHTDKSQGADACRGFQKAIVDEYALSRCDVLVISESGLGKIASFMRGRDQDLYLFYRARIDPFTRNGTFPNKAGW